MTLLAQGRLFGIFLLFFLRKDSVFLDFSTLSVGRSLCYAFLIKHIGGVLVLKTLIAIQSEPLTDLLCASLPQHDIHICRTGNDALQQMECLHPDILILELMLPSMDGITVLQRSSYKPRVILALTNLASQTVLAEAAAVGIQDVLLIPCTVRHIIKHLDALIEKVPSAD